MLLVFQNFSDLRGFAHFIFAPADSCSLGIVLGGTRHNEHFCETRIGVTSSTAYCMSRKLGCFLEV